MNTKQLARHFGSAAQARMALKVSPQLWRHWETNGIPLGRQALIQIATEGALIAATTERSSSK